MLSNKYLSNTLDFTGLNVRLINLKSFSDTTMARTLFEFSRVHTTFRQNFTIDNTDPISTFACKKDKPMKESTNVIKR